MSSRAHASFFPLSPLPFQASSEPELLAERLLPCWYIYLFHKYYPNGADSISFCRSHAASSNVGGGETRRFFVLAAFISLTLLILLSCSASARGNKDPESSSSRPGWVSSLDQQFANTSHDFLFLVSLSAPFYYPDAFQAILTDPDFYISHSIMF